MPVMLKALVGIILKGPDVIERSADRSLQDQAILTISQLLIFNSKKTARLQRHNTDKETLLSVHSGTRKKGLVEFLHILGLGISYKRVLSISNGIGESVCSKFEKDRVTALSSRGCTSPTSPEMDI